MNFKDHSNLEGLHAFLSASKYHWVNYTEDKLMDTYAKRMAAQKGTQLHALANDLIELGVKLPKTKKTLNMYVNDAIGYGMESEQPLFFSMNCFGTPDTIVFKKNKLRIHDLKTGTTPASMIQLEIYTSLFCLEYNISPFDIEIELRIYQLDQVLIHFPEPDNIRSLMDKIIMFDKYIEKVKIGG